VDARTSMAGTFGQQNQPSGQGESSGSEAGSPAPEEGEEDERRDEKSWTPAAKAQHWKRFDRIAQSWERRFSETAADCFEQERRDLLALLSAAKQKAQQEKATVNWSTYEEEVRDYLNQAGALWRKTFLPLVKGIVADQGREWAALLGMQFDIRNLEAEAWFESYLFDFWKDDIGLTTRKDIGDVLQTAQREGWSVPNMQKALGQLFDAYIKNERIDCTVDDLQPWERWFCERQPAHRTELIARTETMKSYNASSQKLFSDWGVQQKEWLTTLDGRERDSHREVNGKVLPIQDAFMVGGQRMMYPGDPNGGVAEVANCRCTLLPVIPETLGVTP